MFFLCVAGCGTMPARDPIPATPPANLPAGNAKWRSTNLNFFIANFSAKAPQDRQAQIITDAFTRWSNVTPLNFTRVMDRAQAHFTIGFGTGGHCELYVNSTLACPAGAAFEATTLGHAYFPEGQNQGQCHMNEAMDWSNERLLFSTLVHELGHTLGLEHLPEATAVMFASDNGQTGDLQLPDIAAIQRLYGSRDGSVRPAPRTMPPNTDANINRTGPTTSLPDADGDGLDDATELFVLGTSSTSADSDGDGLGDGVEAVAGLDPMNEDTDGDGESDGFELDAGSNAYWPDSGLGQDVSAIVGKYAGTDSLGTPIEFTIAADGLVTGTLSLTQFGFPEDYELFGTAGSGGLVELVSYDFFFEYHGTIVGTDVTNGTFETDIGPPGTWTATKVPPRLKLPDIAAGGFKVIQTNPSGENQLQPRRRTDIGRYVETRR